MTDRPDPTQEALYTRAASDCQGGDLSVVAQLRGRASVVAAPCDSLNQSGGGDLHG
ncbi:MAG: hypothetical protein OXC71_04590 [Chloroflexi bacterium]|nr:hypothetical protein [Chloroflexota bacterium]